MAWKDLISISLFVKPLLKGKDDRFLVIEIGEDNVKAASVRADFLNKELRVLKIRSHADLKKLLKKFGRLGKYKIIIGLDSHLASTIYSSILLPRERHKELIDEAELDNLISQAVWKFFDRSRNKVAGKIGVADLDIMLTDVRIRGIKLDGHKVVNPLGFSAKTVEVQFSQTFLSRELIESLKESLPLSQVVLMSESGACWASVIAKAGPDGQNFLLANVLPDRTQLFLSDGSQNSYYDYFRWGKNNLTGSLAADLALEEEIARLVIGKYAKNETSPAFRHRLEILLAKELVTLARGLDEAAKKADTRTVYINPIFQAPAIFEKNFRNRFERSVAVRPVIHDLISQKFGFDIKFKNNADAENAFGPLAAVMEWYLAPQDDKMSQLAKRRVRWLSPL